MKPAKARESVTCQEEKIFLNLAGEFAVASELNRRHILASVTYGALKAVDIFAVSQDMRRTFRIQVKASDKGRWPIGDSFSKTVSYSPDVFWVFVQFPGGLPTVDAYPEALAPRFFVLSSIELGYIAKQLDEDFRKRFLERNGRPFEGRGVPNVVVGDVQKHEGQWQKIVSRLEDTAP